LGGPAALFRGVHGEHREQQNEQYRGENLDPSVRH
jgi:hypothetical protein